jgi:hypothetical protein
MSDLEFDVLDELYFVTHFNELKNATNLSVESLKSTLTELYHKGWLKVYESVAAEISDKQVNMDHNFQNYFYLASKEGLLAHNGR